MAKKIPILLLVCLASGIPSALANGGGYSRGGLESAGDVAGFEPEQTDKIRILDEKLTVRLGQKSAAVEVRYLMSRVGGVPEDFLTGVEAGWGSDCLLIHAWRRQGIRLA